VLGDAINFPLPGLCELPGLPRLPKTYRRAWTSPVRALLIAGTLDDRTRVQNAIDAGPPLAAIVDAGDRARLPRTLPGSRSEKSDGDVL
jgi:hypothetical protein